ncbi:MAG TPA: YceI family protein [Burkholderiales bacterium]|nr:YceI family protein [Burkholderiales bacterium]
MNKILLAILAASVAAPALAAESYTLDSRHTYPSFEVNHLGFSTQRGRFNKTSGRIVLDRQAKTGSVDVVIEAASVDTGLDKLEEHLRGEEFFNAEKFPTLSFKSRAVTFSGDKPATVEGDFTLLGVTRPVTLTITAFNCGVHPLTRKDLCGADATATIKRSEFGMTKYVPGVGDEVKLSIQVEATKD